MPETRYFVAQDKGIVVIRDSDERTVEMLLELGYKEIDKEELIQNGLQTYEGKA